MKQIEVNSEGWCSLIRTIASDYADGKLIPHEWLRRKFGLENLRMKDFDNTEDFIEAIQMQQFSYMTLVDTLRWKLLEDQKIYIKNIRGDGYQIVQPTEQVQYGYDQFLRDFKKAVKDANLIMQNVKSVPSEQQKKDNDLRAKCALLGQMVNGMK